MVMKNIQAIIRGCIYGITLPGMVSFSAHAIDFTPDPSRVLSDPLYMPSRHELYGTTFYQYGKMNGDVNNVNGTPNKSYSTSANTFGQTLEYGLTNRFALTFTDSYISRTTDNDPASGATFSTSANGFTDPGFGFMWRVLDQKTKPFNLDILAVYSPDWVDARTASVTTDGSVANGGSQASGTVAIGYKTRDFTIRGAATAVYVGSRNTLNITNNQTSNTSSVRDYQLAVSTQTRLNEKFSFNAGIGENFNNSYDSTNQTTLLTNTNRPGDVTNLNAALNYTVVPNRLVFGLTYQYNIYADSITQFPNPANNISTTNEDENIFGVRLQYVFF